MLSVVMVSYPRRQQLRRLARRGEIRRRRRDHPAGAKRAAGERRSDRAYGHLSELSRRQGSGCGAVAQCAWPAPSRVGAESEARSGERSNRSHARAGAWRTGSTGQAALGTSRPCCAPSGMGFGSRPRRCAKRARPPRADGRRGALARAAFGASRPGCCPSSASPAPRQVENGSERKVLVRVARPPDARAAPDTHALGRRPWWTTSTIARARDGDHSPARRGMTASRRAQLSNRPPRGRERACGRRRLQTPARRRLSHKPGSVRVGEDDSAVAQNFIGCDREQAFLMPPSLREWLAEDHLAWFVIEAVEEMDLAEFYADYRADGHGRAAYEPSMMVALLLYAYATKQRSARAIERHCRQDIAYRVICANRVPDHATIARFVCRHEASARRALRLGACAVREGGPGVNRRGGDRRHEARREREPRGEPRLRADRPRDRRRGEGRPTRPRMSSSARRAATSCLKS